MEVGNGSIYIHREREYFSRFGISGVNRASSLILFHSYINDTGEWNTGPNLIPSLISCCKL